jgi:ABC-2 type transport system permease protein
MRSTWILAVAMWRGFVRDRMAVFWIVAFPLMFLVLFGGIFAGGDEQSKSELLQVGDVALVDDLPEPAREQFDDAFDTERVDDLDAALEQVRDGDADAAVEQSGDRIELHYSEADPVTAATVQGIFASFVDGANIAATGEPPKYALDSQQVEDESLEAIQYFTPGLLGWAVAMNATFGSALTLVQWRTTKLLRRLRLAPISSGSLVAARILITVAVALIQMTVFIGLGMAAFGLQLSGSWWMVPPLLLCGTLAFMAIGQFVGAISKTVEGASGFANFVVLPMAFLAGSFFPLDEAPGWIQQFAKVLPLRYLNEGMLDVMVRGQGPAAALGPMAVMLGFAVVIGLIATRFFRWEAD